MLVKRHTSMLMEDYLELKEKLQKIQNWIEAYPVTAFPEPDFKKAAKVLKENGMTLDAITASNMRHVLNGIKNIIDNQAAQRRGLMELREWCLNYGIPQEFDVDDAVEMITDYLKEKNGG